mmetsp:Transcript_51455/g.159587  ORF Transcript_51455/g.159587 Transcript_51455/m.159587 type:complete len:259 (+) Transcript_51455:273-1049(+)
MGLSGCRRKSFTRKPASGSSRGTFSGPLVSGDHFHFCVSRKYSRARNSAFLSRSFFSTQTLFQPGTFSGTGAGFPSGVAQREPQPRFEGCAWISLISFVSAVSVMISWWYLSRLYTLTPSTFCRLTDGIWALAHRQLSLMSRCPSCTSMALRHLLPTMRRRYDTMCLVLCDCRLKESTTLMESWANFTDSIVLTPSHTSRLVIFMFAQSFGRRALPWHPSHFPGAFLLLMRPLPLRFCVRYFLFDPGHSHFMSCIVSW